MKAKFSTEKFLHEFRSSNAAQALIPMGYVPNLPIITSSNGVLCMCVPFMKYKVTGVVDKTLVFPVRYVFTIEISSGAIVNFEDLVYNKAFVNVDVNKPVGTFRHEAVKNLTKVEYTVLRRKLFAEYDKMIDFLANDTEYTEADKQAFTILLNQVLEPSLKPFYRALDKSFAKRFFVKM